MNNEIQQNENKEINNEAKTMDVIDCISCAENPDKSFFLNAEFDQSFPLKEILKESDKALYEKEKKLGLTGVDESYIEKDAANTCNVFTNICKGLYCNAKGIDEPPKKTPKLKNNTKDKYDVITKTYMVTLLSQIRKKGSFISKIINRQFEKITKEEIDAFHNELFDNLSKISDSEQWQAEIEVLKFDVECFNKSVKSNRDAIEVSGKNLVNTINESLIDALNEIPKYTPRWHLIVPRVYDDYNNLDIRYNNVIEYFFSTNNGDNFYEVLQGFILLTQIGILEDVIKKIIKEWTIETISMLNSYCSFACEK